jgi:hypothetical protein
MASVTVSSDDVAKRYEGDLSSEFREDYVAEKIADAVDLADTRWGAAINSRLLSGALTERTYKRVICDAVLRVLRNPDGWVSESEGGASGSRRASVASGDLWFTEADEEKLTGILNGPAAPGTVSIGLDRGWA